MTRRVRLPLRLPPSLPPFLPFSFHTPTSLSPLHSFHSVYETRTWENILLTHRTFSHSLLNISRTLSLLFGFCIWTPSKTHPWSLTVTTTQHCSCYSWMSVPCSSSLQEQEEEGADRRKGEEEAAARRRRRETKKLNQHIEPLVRLIDKLNSTSSSTSFPVRRFFLIHYFIPILSSFTLLMYTFVYLSSPLLHR